LCDREMLNQYPIFQAHHFFDGTFWRNEELPSLGIGSRTAFDMGHLPLSGDDGCIMKLSKLKSQNSKIPQSSKPRKILVHINNTNPILIPNSSERQVVKDAGIEIGYDGLTLEL
ncbi:MAG: hypothetical protein AAFX80_01300, partial [Cyanobacteria bacterium J06639_18]